MPEPQFDQAAYENELNGALGRLTSTSLAKDVHIGSLRAAIADADAEIARLNGELEAALAAMPVTAEPAPDQPGPTVQ